PPRTPWRLADQRLQDAVPVRRVTPREAALHARMTLVCSAVRIRRHTHELIAFELRDERAAPARVPASGAHTPIRLTVRVDGLLDQRGSGTRLDARAARDALRVEKR